MRKISTSTYLDSPETLQRQELYYGAVVRDAASPRFAHQAATTRLTVLLDTAVRETRAGTVCVSPMDVVLDRDKDLVVQPDIVFVSHARRAIIGDRIEGAPDLVVEVLSDSTAVRDRGQKLRIYRKYGVRECWLVDSDTWSLELVRLTGPRVRRRVFFNDTPIVSPVLGRLTFTVDEVFGAITLATT